MKDLINHIESLQKEFQLLQPLTLDNQQKLDKKFRLEWDFNSNHIEGNTLTYGETELLIIFGETSGKHEVREFDEMRGHDIALKLIYDLAYDKERGLTEKFIRELNEIILVKPFYKEAITEDGQLTRRLIEIGKYKSFPNSVRLQNGEMFNYPSPLATPALMEDLMSWYHTISNDSLKHPVEVAAELHYRFVSIHPFDDGNGRIARLLMNYHLLKKSFPPVIIKSTDKTNYLFALHEADVGHIEEFEKYVANELKWSLEISIKAAKGEKIDEPDDWDKKIAVLKKGTVGNINLNSKKNIKLLSEVIKKSFIPLVEKLFFKLKPLEELYENSRFYLTINDIHGIVNSSNFRDILNIDSLIKENLYSIFYQHTLNSFIKNGLNTFNSHFNLIFKFTDTTYSISYKDILKTDIEKQYDDNLLDEEFENITSFISEKIYLQIQNKLKER